MLTSRIQQFLDELFIKNTLHTNVVSKSTLQFSQFAKSINACAIKVVLFSDKRGPALIVYPAKDVLDFELLESQTDRKLILDSGHKYKNQLHGFSIRHLPPFGRLFQMMTIFDTRLAGFDSYLLDINQGDSFIEVDRKGLVVLLNGSSKKKFCKPMPLRAVGEDTLPKQKAEVANMTTKTEPLLTLKSLDCLFSKGQDLPVMPAVGSQLIELKGADDFELIDLIHLIESDPMLSAKIIAYASSPFFSYQGKLESVQEAVYHVLGMDLSLNISLALAVGAQFKGPLRGPVGALSTWRHAVFCAVLSQSIAAKIKNRPNLKIGTAYLHGLMHNIGFLVLGHVFTKKFTQFNKAVEEKRDATFDSVEKNVLGVSHAQVGSMLLNAWSLPQEYGIVVDQHHNGDYSGPHDVYAHIVYIANALLLGVEIGDASDMSLPSHLLDSYELKESELHNMLEIVVQWRENIDNLAQQLVA